MPRRLDKTCISSRARQWFVVAAVTLSIVGLSTNLARADANLQFTLTDAGIQPSNVTVAKGETVNLSVVNRGSKTHNFVIPAFFIFTQNLGPGKSVTASFAPDKTGDFPYYSDTGGKPEPGIRGTMRVTP